ncbi:HNH endonuclease signature motif containing protein [Corynebacterium freneyi]
MSTAHDDGAGDELAGLVAKLTRNIEGMIRQLTALPIGAVGGDGHHGDEINHVEAGVVRLRNAMRAADVVFAEYANAVVVNELHKRGGGRATPRSYLKRLFDITDTEARHLLAYRDALHPEPDPDPPADATPEELEAAEKQLHRRRAIGERLAASARKGNFPVCRSSQMNEVLGSFTGQEHGLMEDVAEAITDNIDSTPADLFRSMCANEARKRLEKRKSATKAGTSQARLTVRAPNVDGLCKLDAMLPAPTAAVLNALLHLNAGPGAFLDLPDGVKDPRTLTQRRVHALHHVLLFALQQSGAGAAAGVGACTGDGADVGAAGGFRSGAGGVGRNAPEADNGAGEDQGRGLLRWLRTESTYWDPERCPFVADLYSGIAQPLARPNAGVASIVMAIRASDFDDELHAAQREGPPEGERRVFKRFPTNTGIDLTLPELVSLGAHKYAWLALLDDITGRPLDLGRSRRTADLWQRVLLLASETVCTYPGCEQPADMCETHHIDAWLFGGGTDIGNCTLRCPEHHRENDDADAGHASGRATHPRETGRVGHVKPGRAPEFNDSPAARRSPGWSESWWATYQSDRREAQSTSTGWWSWTS